MPQDPSQGGSSAESGGEVEDFGQLLQEAQEQLVETRGHLDQTRQEVNQVRGESAAARQTLERLQRALSGDEDRDRQAGRQRSEKTTALKAQLDEYLQAALDAERRGSPIPLTTNLAVQFFEQAIAGEKDKAALEAELAKMRSKIEQATDPAQSLAMTAYTDIDGKIITALNTIYGAGDEYEDVKQGQFKAIADMVVGELRHMQRDDPAKYDQIIRQPNARAGLVRRFVERAIPPRARAIMQQDNLERTEMSIDETLGALRQARAALAENPELAPVIEELKAELWEKWWMQNQGKGMHRRMSA